MPSTYRRRAASRFSAHRQQSNASPRRRVGAVTSPSDGTRKGADTRGSHVSVLGGFRFQPETEAVLVLSGSSQRLLAFLALHERSMTRNAVAGTLWPDVSEEHAYSSLRSTLSRMHGSSRDAVVVNVMDLSLADDVVVDMRESQGLAHRLLDTRNTPRESDLSAGSVDALSADLLPDWYDDWVVIETEAWRQLRLHALEALSG